MRSRENGDTFRTFKSRMEEDEDSRYMREGERIWTELEGSWSKTTRVKFGCAKAGDFKQSTGRT